MTRISATFEIADWNQLPSADPGAGESMGRATLSKTYAGDITGTSVTEMIMAVADESNRAYLAQERIVGTLDGREGSFVLQHGAAGGDGFDPRQWAFVVPGTGTGDLAGLAGDGILGHGVLDLDVVLP